MNSVIGHPSTYNPVGRILEAVPEFNKLHISTRNEVANFIERKLGKFSLKLKLSPYAPYGEIDRLGVNANFGEGLHTWLTQFPEKHRLGLLAASLSTVYITEDEQDSFIEISLSSLREAVIEAAEQDKSRLGFGTPSEWILLKQDLRPFAVSEFGAYEKVVRKIPLPGSRDRANHPVRGVLDELVKSTFLNLRGLADKEVQSLIYRDQWAAQVAGLIRSLRSSHIVLVEDGSFSGGRIKREANRFLRLINILFSGFEEQMARQGHKPPWVYLLVIFGTSEAVDAIRALGPLGGKDKPYERFVPLFGHVFDKDISTVAGLPPAVEQLNALTQKVELNKKLRQAIQFFHENYSYKYWSEDTAIGRMLKLPDRDLPYGLGGKGWTLLTHVNCPNDSLPVLWYPHMGAPSCSDIKPLFARLESQSQSESGAELREAMEIAQADRDGYLRNFLKSVHSEA